MKSRLFKCSEHRLLPSKFKVATGSQAQTSDKGRVLKEYAGSNYKGIWARRLIPWKKSTKTLQLHLAYHHEPQALISGAEVWTTSISVRTIANKSAEPWEEQSCECSFVYSDISHSSQHRGRGRGNLWPAQSFYIPQAKKGFHPFK